MTLEVAKNAVVTSLIMSVYKKAAFVLILISLTALCMESVLSVKAVTEIATSAFISVEPNPVGVGQGVHVNMWIEPDTPTPTDSFIGSTAIITDPNGSIVNVGPFIFNSDGSTHFDYVMTRIGVYTLQQSYPGQYFANNTIWYRPSMSPLITLNVTQEPVEVYQQIVVPDDYPTIQAAIDNASEGASIFVKSGVYYETLVITKSISLIGEGQENTFINANNATENVIYINASNVSIEGFTITNNRGFPTSVPQPDGIRVEYFSNVINITNNTISSIQYGNGISLLHSSGNTIERNNITRCGASGIFISAGGSNIIRENSVTSNYFGASIEDESHNNTIVGNYFANSTYNYGLEFLDRCSNNTVVGNAFAYNQFGLAVDPSANNTFYCNNFIDNNNQVLLFGTKDNWAGLVNYWDNGTGGNYWSDYYGTEIDDSGVGSLPYFIRANGDSNVVYVDNYPLISPFNVPTTPPGVIPEFSSLLAWLIVFAATSALLKKKQNRVKVA